MSAGIDPERLVNGAYALREEARSSSRSLRRLEIGDCLENAVVEAFWARTQVELLNRQRWHPNIGMRTPGEDQRFRRKGGRSLARSLCNGFNPLKPEPSSIRTCSSGKQGGVVQSESLMWGVGGSLVTAVNE